MDNLSVYLVCDVRHVDNLWITKIYLKCDKSHKKIIGGKNVTHITKIIVRHSRDTSLNVSGTCYNTSIRKSSKSLELKGNK